MRHDVSRRQLLSISALSAVTGAGLVGALDLQPRAQARRRTPTERVAARHETSTAGCSTDVVWRRCTRDRLVALTFDDGPDPRWTPMVLEALAEHGARATFFQMGDAVRAHPEVTLAVQAAGHEVANHGAGHRDLTELGEDEVWENLASTHQAILDVTGVAPTLVRPPYGRIDSLGLAAAARLGYRVALWSHHLPTSGAEAKVDLDIATASPGMIILCHDGRSTPAESLYVAVRRLLATLTADGYSFVTVSDLLAAEQSEAV